MGKIKNIFCLSVLCCVFASCSWQIPEKISVKTQAEYNFSIGSFTQDLGNNFSATELFKNMGVKKSRVYDYYPGKKDSKKQQFYMRVPLLEIPIDFSSFFKSSSIAESVEGMSFSQEIEIPSVDINVSQKIDVSEISRTINSGMKISGPIANGHVSFALSFDSISYSSGYMTIQCSGIPDGVSVTINNESESRTASFSSGIAKINISNYSFYEDSMSIAFSEIYNLNYVGSIDAESQIQKAQGVTNDFEITVPFNVNFRTGSKNDTFESCTVKEGVLFTELKMPADWINVSIEYEMSTSGGMAVSSSRTPDLRNEISLAGQQITSGDTNIAVIMYLNFDNASFSFGKNPEFKTNAEIDSFSKIAINLKDIKTVLGEEENFSDTMMETVKSITLGSSGLTGTYVNTLPAGNDIQLIASSSFLGLNDGQGVLSSCIEDGKFSVMSPAGTEKYVKIEKKPSKPNEYNSWDISMELRFPGYTKENPSRLELTDVAPFSKYKVALSVEPETNWKQMVIVTNDMTQKDISPLGFNLNTAFGSINETLGVDFASQLQIHSVPVYLYCTKPKLNEGYADPFAETQFMGAIKMYIGSLEDKKPVLNSENKPEEEVFFADGTEKQVIPYVSVPNVEIKDNVVITDIAMFNHSNQKNDIAHLINNVGAGNDIFIDFDVSFANKASEKTITVTPEMLDGTSSAASIGVFAIIVIPLEFDVNNDNINIDMQKLMGLDEASNDIFGRTSASDTTIIDNISGIIRSVSINYESDILPFYSTPDIILRVDLGYETTPIEAGMQAGTISIDAGDIDMLLENYPATPKMSCIIKKNSRFSIPRATKMGIGFNMKICTDGTIDVMGGN